MVSVRDGAHSKWCTFGMVSIRDFVFGDRAEHPKIFIAGRIQNSSAVLFAFVLLWIMNSVKIVLVFETYILLNLIFFIFFFY